MLNSTGPAVNSTGTHITGLLAAGVHALIMPPCCFVQLTFCDRHATLKCIEPSRNECFILSDKGNFAKFQYHQTVGSNVYTNEES